MQGLQQRLGKPASHAGAALHVAVTALVSLLTIVDADAGARGVDDSTLFSQFVDVVERDYATIDFVQPSLPVMLDSSFAMLRASAETLNANFERFDGDEVLLLIADLQHLDAAVGSFAASFASGELANESDRQRFNAVRTLLLSKRQSIAATLQVAEGNNVPVPDWPLSSNGRQRSHGDAGNGQDRTSHAAPTLPDCRFRQ
jgi:hypothetical protein